MHGPSILPGRGSVWLGRGGVLAVMAAVLLATAPLSAAAARFDGPFELDDGIVFYIVDGEGEGFDARIQWRDGRRSRSPAPLLIRGFDPRERQVLRDEFAGEGLGGSGNDVPTETRTVSFPAAGPGVYQLRLTGGGQVQLELSRRLSFGVLGTPETLVGRDEQFARSYFYLPPGLDRLPVRGRGEFETLRIEAPDAGAQLNLRGRDPGGRVDLPGDGGQVWGMSIRGRGRYELSFDHLPIILCPDVDTARAIRGSVYRLEGGGVAFHRFQVRAHELLEQYRQLPRSRFELDLPDLARYAEHWQRNPVRNQMLLGQYGIFTNLRPLLHEQNLDPDSPWFGTIHSWKDQRGGPRPDPLADYHRLDRDVDNFSATFAAVHALDEPFNPLYRNEVLLNRIVIEKLQTVMLMKEHELLQARPGTYQGGARAFSLKRTAISFPLIAEHLPSQVREVWAEFMQRLADQHVNARVPSTVNQWTAIMLGVHDVYRGSGDTWYRDRVHRQIDWMLDPRPQGFGGQAPAGYHRESGGPDPSYNGITGYDLAVLYHQLDDPAYRRKVHDSLQRMYDLFNHTVAPEPGDQTRLGANNFAHRQPGDWTSPQHGAGLLIMAGILPEAAIHRGRVWIFPEHTATADPQAVQDQARRIVRRLSYYRPDHFERSTIRRARPGLFYKHYIHFPDQMKQGQLPVVASRSFIRNFGDEFFAIRRPAYYALVYAGQPMGTWQRGRRPDDPDGRHPRNGGGISLFWSPAFGSSLIGRNWSTYAAHTLSAVEGERHRWEDYWSIENRFDDRQGRLEVTGSILDTPLTFTREYRFLEDRILIELTLEAGEDYQADYLLETFPYPLEKGDREMKVTALNDRGRPIQQGAARALLFHSDDLPEAHLLIFDRARQWRAGPHQGDGDRSHGAAQTGLPVEWQAGQQRRFTYTLIPVPRAQAARAVTNAARLLRP